VHAVVDLAGVMIDALGKMEADHLLHAVVFAADAQKVVYGVRDG